MIELTRLNGKAFTLNALYIETIDSFPDTTITLTNGRKYIVLEPHAEVRERINALFREIHILGNPHIRGEEDDEEE